MISPVRAGLSQPVSARLQLGNSTAGGAQAQAKSSAVILFHPSRNADYEQSAGRIGMTQFGRCPIQRGDSLLNFAEAILTGAILAERASQNLLHRVEHLSASVRSKYGPDTEHADAKELQG